MAEGAAWGTGTAIAREAVGSLFSSGNKHESAPAPQQQQQAPVTSQMSDPCAEMGKYFAECMSKNNGDLGICQPYFDAMQSCKMNASPAF